MNIDQKILTIVANIWDTMLRLPVEASQKSPSPLDDKISACVQVTGAWEGTISLDFDAKCSAMVAGAMLGLDPAITQPDDIRDALGEIANMVGGNIKSLLPGTNLLSLPTVVDGKQLQAKLPGTEGALILRVPLRSAGHQFAVSLLSKKNMAA